MTIETKKALDKAAELIDLSAKVGTRGKIVIFIEDGKATGVSLQDTYCQVCIEANPANPGRGIVRNLRKT